jgi:hypothetical protein
MADPFPLDGSHALDAGSGSDRDAKIEQLLLTGLDHYFASQYEQAINVWTRALFLDRNHARARAYIERARSAVAERQRRSEELLQDGVAAFERGDGGAARRLLREAIDGGAPADEALSVLSRLDRLERAEAPVPAARGGDVGAESVAPYAPAPDARAAPPARRRRTQPVLVAALLIVLALAAGAVAFTSSGWNWAALLVMAPSNAPAAAGPGVQPLDLPVPRRGEMVLGRARALAAGGHLHDALAALDGIRPTDAERGDADRLRVQIQRELLAFASPPVGTQREDAPAP